MGAAPWGALLRDDLTPPEPCTTPGPRPSSRVQHALLFPNMPASPCTVWASQCLCTSVNITRPARCLCGVKPRLSRQATSWPPHSWEEPRPPRHLTITYSAAWPGCLCPTCMHYEPCRACGNTQGLLGTHPHRGCTWTGTAGREERAVASEWGGQRSWAGCDAVWQHCPHAWPCRGPLLAFSPLSAAFVTKVIKLAGLQMLSVRWMHAYNTGYVQGPQSQASS